MKRAEQLATAVATLREFVSEPIQTKRDIAGVLQGFSFCFELAWKALQDEVAARGYLERGPRPVLSAAFDAGLIAEGAEEQWAELVADRNLVAHTYRPEWAVELVERISRTYLPLFEDVVRAIDIR